MLGTIIDAVTKGIGDVASVVGDTNWTAVLGKSVMPSIIGAGVGALASAVTDGDMTEGLLYGAAGGLAMGGLSEFGSQFGKNWGLVQSGMSGAMGTFDQTYMDNLDFDFGVMEDPFTAEDASVLESMGLTLPGSGGGTVVPPEDDWFGSITGMFTNDKGAITEAGAQLALGGASMLGNLLDDSPTQGELYEQQLKMQQDATDSRKAALASFDRTAGDYQEPKTSVRDFVTTRGMEGNTKKDMGVTIG